MSARKPRIALLCAYLPCSQPFSVIPSQAHRAKYCSRLCLNSANAAAKSARSQALSIERHCTYEPCSKPFIVPPRIMRHPKHGRFCSKACAQLAWGLNKRLATRPLAERFWAKVAIAGPEDCWLWQASIFGNGYGKIVVNDGLRERGAHVVSWYLHTGDWPAPGMYVCHNCPNGDNPACVNPRHLWLGTQSQNLFDAGAKGHMSHKETRPRGEHHWTRRRLGS
jgi:hypothetical protein